VLTHLELAGRRVTVFTPDLPPAEWHGANLLVLQDGQNLFEPDRAHGGQTWEVAETLTRLVGEGVIAPTVVAGIDHAGSARVREYGYGAAAYGRRLIREILPQLRARFDVRQDMAGTWLGGSSMGAYVTLHVAAHHPDVFGRLFAFSPSVWWRRRAILRTIRRPGLLGGFFSSHARGLAPAADVWVSIGLDEGDEAIDDARRLRDVILSMRHGDASHLHYREYANGAHSEAAWAAQLPDALRATAGRER
jgi:enterochelin esterase-like enzyme